MKMLDHKNFLLDKNGREILVGDILKVFHYTAAVRREKCYMYKQVLERKGSKHYCDYFIISHLDLTGGTYQEHIDGRQILEYEIVQGFGSNGISFKDRAKYKL